ncbi:MAG TPA: GAF domain-containing sensor histidine kinase [Kofleriaceae bacterium]|nr:GAF domain-containing sensor histidine kinase [Kofleriaceae bacterium]
MLLLDESGTRLHVAAAPGLPATYNKMLEGASIGPRAGSCGTAAYYGQPVHVEDILTDPLWVDYRDLAKLSGMRGCWSTPIFSADQRVLGTFALYHKQPGLPDRVALELIERATHVASLVIERRLLDEEQRALAARIEAVREEERTGIARELHDELGQALTALKLDVAWIARNTHENGSMHARLDEMAQLVDTTLQSVRRISSELRPVILDELGLGATIQWQADEFGARTNIELNVENALPEQPIDRTVSTAAFRIFQEALTNIARHAEATRVDVRLRASEGNLIMEVADDGVGLPELVRRGSPQSLGLVGMRERARRLGGDCIVMRRQPRGTLVVLSVPLGAAPEMAAHPVH